MNINNSEGVEITKCYLLNMEIHKTITVYEHPFFQVLRVPTGWIYSYWNQTEQDYTRDIFIKE